MKTITTKQFIALCNDYIASQSGSSYLDRTIYLADYLKYNGYLDQSTSANNYSFLDFEKDVPKKIKLVVPDDNGKLSDTTKSRLRGILDFLAYHSNLITDEGKFTKERLIQDIVSIAAVNDATIELDSSTREKLIQNFKLYDENMAVPKSHPKTNFILKKIVKPALISGAVFGTVFGILSKIPIVANLSLFSPNAALATASWISLGVFAGAAAATLGSLAISKLTRLHYKKYCQKGNNLEAMNSAEINSVAAIEHSTTVLPIKRLMDKIHKSNQKIIQHRNGNWWQRNISSYFQRKWHRNQLWAVASYTQYLRDQYANGDVATQNKCRILMEYIDNNISTDMRDNFAGYPNAYRKLENADIYATIAMSRDKKDSVQEIKNKCHELVRDLTLDRLSSTSNNEMFKLVDSLKNKEALEEVNSKEVNSTAEADKTATTEQVQSNNQAIDNDPIIFTPYVPVSNTKTEEESSIAQSVENTTIINNTNSTDENSNTSKNTKPKKAEAKLVVKLTIVKVKEMKSKYQISGQAKDGEKSVIEVRRTSNPDLDIIAVQEAVRSLMTNQ